MKALKEQDRLALDTLFNDLRRQQETYVGYPNSQLLANEGLARFLDLTINNVGDPFHGNNGMNTCSLERDVIDFFRELLHLDPDNYWGYVTNGGSEGNLHGLFLGRETFRDAVIYYSRASHYSVPKAARLLGGCSARIDTDLRGEIDYQHLRDTLRAFRHLPALINANIGTTMTGAIDNVERILEILEDVGIRRYHIHCDAALFGTMLPFIEGAPVFDFRLPIGSLAISGHKFLGSPIPCGIALTRQQTVRRIEGAVEYIGSLDATISGSRDGFSVLVLWQAIRRWGREGLAELVADCLDNAVHTQATLDAVEWPQWRNPCSNIVVIQRPPDGLVRKWQLASEGELSHIILMPGVRRDQIDRLAADLEASRRRSAIGGTR
jgi:histidine decarboxylase